MKRVLAFLLALATVFSLGLTAFAAEETGTITITNASIDQTYTVYKIFDASVKKAADNVTVTGVAYSIEKDNQFFAALFGEDGKTENPFFIYDATADGEVRKKKDVNDSELVTYLTNLVENGTYTAAADPVKATTAKVEFKGLPYGYYLISSTLGTTVTINSNTPKMEVIDKNQEPAPDFNKQIWGVDKEGKPAWVDSNSAGVGDEITYKISFTATNYDGDQKIKYYQIHDEKGDAIWAEFNSFTVKVGDDPLEKGYYLNQGGENTDKWLYFGNWDGVPVEQRKREDAEWYLVHLGYDQFRITIPWLENQTLTDVTDASGNVVSYSLGFAENAKSKFNSPAKVEITYRAVVEAGAAIGDTTHGNRFNKANASWTSQYETGSTPPDEVVTYVYGIGLLKDDLNTKVNLPGAKFRLYSDKDCTQPVYVIPTNIKGIYGVDTLGKPIQTISGLRVQDPRVVYAAYLDDYLSEARSKGKEQDNYVVSQANGKLAILGLKAGTYYLDEVEAPDGYNALTVPVELTAGKDPHSFTIFVNDNGEVKDIQQTDGIFKEKTYNLTHTVVHNSQGVELPSTGGAGKMMLLTFGSVIAMAFAVLMITQKKMSAYND